MLDILFSVLCPLAYVIKKTSLDRWLGVLFHPLKRSCAPLGHARRTWSQLWLYSCRTVQTVSLEPCRARRIQCNNVRHIPHSAMDGPSQDLQKGTRSRPDPYHTVAGALFCCPSTPKRSASSLRHSYSRPSLGKKQERDTRRARTRDFAARIECDYSPSHTGKHRGSWRPFQMPDKGKLGRVCLTSKWRPTRCSCRSSL